MTKTISLIATAMILSSTTALGAIDVGGGDAAGPTGYQTHAIDVGGTEAIDVGGTKAIDVGGTKAIDVGGTKAIDVGGTKAIDVGGGKAIDVGGGKSLMGKITGLMAYLTNWINSR